MRRDPKVNMEFEVKSSIDSIDYFLERLDEWAAPQKVFIKIIISKKT